MKLLSFTLIGKETGVLRKPKLYKNFIITYKAEDFRSAAEFFSA
jgi:hypothetical protein